MPHPTTVTAAVLVIGDEILSGRTKDANIGYIAEYLGKLGVDLREARVVPDVEDGDRGGAERAARPLRLRDHHGRHRPDPRRHHRRRGRAERSACPSAEDPRAMAILLERYAPADLTPARRRMTRMPEGAELVDNPISRAPGFRIGNVFVLAGVPSVMQAMLDSAVKDMRTGAVMQVASIEAGGVPEGRYGDALAEIAAANPAVSIGSYPSFKDGRFMNQIVVRGKDAAAVQAARAAVEAMLGSIRGDGKPL